MFRIYNVYLEKYDFILNHHPMHGFCIDSYTLPFIPYHLRMYSRHTGYRPRFPNSCTFLYIVFRTHQLRMGINNLLQKIRCTLCEQNIFWEEKIHVIPSCIFQKHLQESLVKTKQTTLFSHCDFISVSTCTYSSYISISRAAFQSHTTIEL